jgi:hypothetical protein
VGQLLSRLPVCGCDKVAIGAVEEIKSKLPPQWDAKNAVVPTHASGTAHDLRETALSSGGRAISGGDADQILQPLLSPEMPILLRPQPVG